MVCHAATVSRYPPGYEPGAAATWSCIRHMATLLQLAVPRSGAKTLLRRDLPNRPPSVRAPGNTCTVKIARRIEGYAARGCAIHAVGEVMKLSENPRTIDRRQLEHHAPFVRVVARSARSRAVEVPAASMARLLIGPEMLAGNMYSTVSCQVPSDWGDNW